MLSKAQQKVFDYLVDYINKYGYPPAIRDICNGIGLKSTSSVHGHLEKLAEYGYIRKYSSKTRAIEILNNEKTASAMSDHSTIFIPLVGEVAAGEPIFAQENIEEYLPIHQSFVGEGNHFFLRIKGDSMIKAGIFNRDYVLIKEQSSANNGDIVCALIGDSATIKTYYKETNQIRLQPENDAMSPIYSKDVTVIGKVKAVIRRMQ